MQLRPRNKLTSGAWDNIYVRGKRPKRPAYMKPGPVVVIRPKPDQQPEKAQ